MNQMQQTEAINKNGTLRYWKYQSGSVKTQYISNRSAIIRQDIQPSNERPIKEQQEHAILKPKILVVHFMSIWSAWPNILIFQSLKSPSIYAI